MGNPSNTRSYCRLIAREFGGLMKDELYLKLQKLVLLAKFEERNNQHPDAEYVSDMRILRHESVEKDDVDSEIIRFQRVKDFDRYTKSTWEASISMTERSISNRYDRSRAVIFFTKKFEGWHPINGIPMDVADIVINLIDMDKYIEYNDECTHFRYTIIKKEKYE